MICLNSQPLPAQTLPISNYTVKQFDDELAAEEDSQTVFTTKHFAVFRFCPEATCMGFVYDEADCGCEDQCEAIAEYNAYVNGDNNNDDSDACEEACQAQCDDFSKWQRSGKSGNWNAQQENGNGRDLQYWNSNMNSNKYSSYKFDFYTNWGDDKEILGARGEGCQSNYGEYMIELSDYLEMMMEFQEERFDTYCNYCEECLYQVYLLWMKNGGHRDLKYEDFKASPELQDQAHRDLGGNVNGGQANGKYYNVCPEYDTCQEYSNMCNQGMDDSLTQYFECQEVEKANGQVAYVGPHCAEDGFTITLGVYSDEYCSDYIGNGAQIENFIGQEMNIDEDELKSYYNSANGVLDLLQFSNEDDVCIPCRKAVSICCVVFDLFYSILFH